VLYFAGDIQWVRILVNVLDQVIILFLGFVSGASDGGGTLQSTLTTVGGSEYLCFMG
jgi:hypothetical protein